MTEMEKKNEGPTENWLERVSGEHSKPVKTDDMEC